MKHFEPLMTHLSPFLVAVVFIPERSEPASGSVRQNEASSGASERRPRYSFLSSSEAPSTIGAVARPLHDREVPMPETPHAVSSSVGEAAEVLLLELLGGAEHDRRGGQAVARQGGADARTAPGDLLLDERAVEEAE